MVQAFTKAELRMLASHELGCNLDADVGGGNLNEIVFNFVELVCRTGREHDLIAAVQRQRPNIALPFKSPQEAEHAAAPAANVFSLAVHYSEKGLLIGNRKEYEANFAEAMYEVGEEGASLNIDLRLKYEDLLQEAIAKIRSEPLTPERRIVITQIKNQLKHCDRKRRAVLFAVPYLFRPPLSYHLQEYTLLVDCIEGIGISLFDYNSGHEKDGHGIDLWDSKQQFIVKFGLDADESAAVAQNIKLPIFRLVGSGWNADDLPKSALCRKAIPAVLMELFWLQSDHPTQFAELDLTSAMTVGSWRIGLS